MHRRRFLSLLATGGAALACRPGAEATPQALGVRPFSRERLHASLERLRLAYEAKQRHVSATLLPALAESELRARCSWFPHPLPAELVALYGWRNGQKEGAWEEEFPFWFRDCALLNVELVAAEYRSMVDSYGRADFEWGIDLATCFPFAGFNGGWYVFPCAGQRLDRRIESPIISVFEGVDVYYYSLEQLVETCVEWVEQPHYPASSPADEQVHLRIWTRHNPGIFGPGGPP